MTPAMVDYSHLNNKYMYANFRNKSRMFSNYKAEIGKSILF